MCVLEDIGLCVKKPMIPWVDCKGAFNLTYGWNVSGLTKHVSVRACFLNELKETNLILCILIPTANMVDIYTIMCHHNYIVVIDILFSVMTMMKIVSVT